MQHQDQVTQKINELVEMMDDSFIDSCLKGTIPQSYHQLKGELTKLDSKLDLTFKGIDALLKVLSAPKLGLLKISEIMKKPTQDLSAARENFKLYVKQMSQMMHRVHDGLTNQDFVNHASKFNSVIKGIHELLERELPNQNHPVWCIPNIGQTSDDRTFYAEPKEVLSKEQLGDYLKVLTKAGYKVKLDQAKMTLFIVDLHLLLSGKKEIKQNKVEVKEDKNAPKTILEFKNPEEILVRDVWNKQPYSVKTAIRFPQWNESIVVTHELTEAELKTLPDKVLPIDEEEITKLRLESREPQNRLAITTIDAIRGDAPRIDGYKIKKGQCIALGGGRYGKEELDHDYTFVLHDNNKELITYYSPQNVVGLLMHSAWRKKPKNGVESQVAHYFEHEDFDDSVDQNKLNDTNTYLNWRLYQNKYVFTVLTAARDIEDEYLTVGYSLSWWEGRNWLPDFFFKAGPMLDSKLHRKRIEVQVWYDTGGGASREFDRQDLIQKAKSDSCEIGFMDNDNFGFVLSNKAICKAFNTPLTPYRIILPEAAIESRFKLNSQNERVTIIDPVAPKAKKLREASADEKDFDQKQYEALVKSAKDAKRLNAPSTNGYTALHWAIEKDQKAKIQILLKAGADRDYKLHESFKSAAELAKVKGINLDEILNADISTLVSNSSIKTPGKRNGTN